MLLVYTPQIRNDDMDNQKFYLFHFKCTFYGDIIVFAKTANEALDKCTLGDDFTITRYDPDEVLHITTYEQDNLDIHIID